jgi:deoxyribodipyrimidine photo-lyase
VKKAINIFWFRRDLRLDDNVGLNKALQGKFPVLPLFIFDSEILSELPEDDARVTFIFERIQALQKTFLEHGSSIEVRYGKPLAIFKELIKEYKIQNVITNRDYESYGQKRDAAIEKLLDENQMGFFSFKDHVIFEKNEVVKADGSPYVVYTPYMKQWKEKFKAQGKAEIVSKPKFDNLLKTKIPLDLGLDKIGFKLSSIKVPDYDLSGDLIENYEATRNFPARDATSHIGPHLRFGTVSIRKAVEKAESTKNEVFLQELIWREFFIQILWHFPETVHNAFRKKYDRIVWRNNESEFETWKSGTTGYPLVDAGMRQLAATGYMHNRVRMVVASFLCKHLLIDWRWGEAYFAEKLLDYEQASNVGNWQWAAGSGVDAAPYFRIFNPTSQLEKFDSDKAYVKTWIEEYEQTTYPSPVVDHKMARERCLKAYKTALNQ